MIAGTAVVALAIVLSLILVGRDDSSGSSETPTTARTTTRTSPGASATTPATRPAPGTSAIPARIPGFVVSPVEIGSSRESLVFRTRNTILNGLEGAASDYGLEIAETRRGSESGLLIGVVAVPGASPPDIPRDVNRIVALEPLSEHRTRGGRPITVYRVPGYHLAVVDAGPRRAVVAIAARRRQVDDLADAVAQGLSSR